MEVTRIDTSNGDSHSLAFYPKNNHRNRSRILISLRNFEDREVGQLAEKEARRKFLLSELGDE